MDDAWSHAPAHWRAGAVLGTQTGNVGSSPTSAVSSRAYFRRRPMPATPDCDQLIDARRDMQWQLPSAATRALTTSPSRACRDQLTARHGDRARGATGTFPLLRARLSRVRACVGVASWSREARALSGLLKLPAMPTYSAGATAAKEPAHTPSMLGRATRDARAAPFDVREGEDGDGYTAQLCSACRDNPGHRASITQQHDRRACT